MATIGICEDDPTIRGVLQRLLRRDGHEVVSAHTGGEAMEMFVDRSLDAIVMDIGLPDSDGRDVCQALRAAGQPAPILFLTAYSAQHEKIAGFTAGGDDYVTKPFDITELSLRIKALSRRARSSPPGEPAALVLDPLRHAVRVGEREASLTPTEFRMLAALAGRPGEVVRRATVVAAAWPDGALVSENTIDSYVRRLRIKLQDVDSPVAIQTHRGIGLSLR